jgi:hypothetical protein
MIEVELIIMNNKSKVQNPLTIIAIFAGIAEIAGTTVLLGLPLEIQKIFVWFVMIFPLGLVTAFFMVLLSKHEVLYAPSDFSNEQLFVDLLNRNKKMQTYLKEASKIVEEVENSTKSTSKDDVPNKDTDITEKLNAIKRKLETAQQNNSNATEELSSYISVNVSKNILIEILVYIEKAGAEGVTKKELSEKFGLNRATLSRRVLALERRGLIKSKFDRYFSNKISM